AGVFSYSASIDAQWVACSIAVTYARGSVSLTYAPTAASSTVASSGAFSASFPMTLGGLTLLYVNSSTDGSYTLSIQRANWEITTVALRAISGAPGSNVAAVSFTPAFSSG